MKVEPVSVVVGFVLALVLLQAKKFMDSRKEGFCSCGAAI
jgi:hypothetical protein